MGRFDTPEVVHTDRGTAFHNELVSELHRAVTIDCLLKRGERTS